MIFLQIHFPSTESLKLLDKVIQMKPDFVDGQSNERLIASGFLVEASSWAPNGRVLVFTKGSRHKGKGANGLNRIYTIDFTGYNEHIIPTPSDASDPDWSHVID